MTINSLNNSKIMLLKKLYGKKYRDEEKMFVVEGEHLVNEASKTALLKEVYVVEGNNYEYQNVNYVTEDVMKKITSLESIPSIIGLCTMVGNTISGNKILMLDNIQDPGNLGTIIRSAVAFNIETIIVSNDTVDMYNPKVLRSTQGMNFHLNIVVADLKESIMNLKYKDFIIYGTSLNNKTDLRNIKVSDKYALIMGNEGQGIKEDLLQLCDENIYIKMNQDCESLNVGVATGIILYELDK